MAESTGFESRRRFFLKSAFLLAGNLWGFSLFSKALADPSPTRTCPARIALIIDDIGYSCCRAREFLDLNVPITFAVLPRLANSHSLACEIRALGREVMLHQPMEPFNSEIDPGPGAVYVGDPDNRIAKIIEENLSEIPFAGGVNNHMGSRFTSCQGKMNQALQVVKERDLFFVDSLTSSRSTGYETARSLHVPSACRNFFLDHHPEESLILSQLRKLVIHAGMYGTGVGIGHPHQETLRALARFLGGLERTRVRLVPISDLIFWPGAFQGFTRCPQAT